MFKHVKKAKLPKKNFLVLLYFYKEGMNTSFSVFTVLNDQFLKIVILHKHYLMEYIKTAKLD